MLNRDKGNVMNRKKLRKVKSKWVVVGISALALSGIGDAEVQAHEHAEVISQQERGQTPSWSANTVSEIAESIGERVNDTDFEYTVEYGDTLWGISQATDVSVNNIAKLNGIENSNLILVNDILTVRTVEERNDDHAVIGDQENASEETVDEEENTADEKAKQKKVAAEKVEAERAAAEKVEQEKALAEKAEAERVAAEKAEQEKVAAEKAKAERAAEKAEQEKALAEKAEAERLAAEKAEQKKAEAEKAEAERKRIAEEKAAEAKEEAERIAAAKLAAEKEEARKVEQVVQTSESKSNSDGFIRPANGHVSSRYGYRVHPITGTRRLHAGLDLAGSGDIVAAQSGRVIRAQYHRSWGYYVKVDHGNGYETLYAHMRPGLNVSVGEQVSQGEKIGTMGTTGSSTGVHLHLEVYKNGSTVNPAPYFGL